MPPQLAAAAAQVEAGRVPVPLYVRLLCAQERTRAETTQVGLGYRRLRAHDSHACCFEVGIDGIKKQLSENRRLGPSYLFARPGSGQQQWSWAFCRGCIKKQGTTPLPKQSVKWHVTGTKLLAHGTYQDLPASVEAAKKLWSRDNSGVAAAHSAVGELEGD